MSDGKKLVLDPDAESAASDKPAFIERPDGTPVYHGFPIVSESETDGWYFGTITDYEDLDGCEYGDGYVVAPDATRAGLEWQVGDFETQEVLPPDKERWGVYCVAFPTRVKNTEDLVDCFRAVLPGLKLIHSKVVGGSD